jgi:hypothetical protein
VISGQSEKSVADKLRALVLVNSHLSIDKINNSETLFAAPLNKLFSLTFFQIFMLQKREQKV